LWKAEVGSQDGLFLRNWKSVTSGLHWILREFWNGDRPCSTWAVWDKIDTHHWLQTWEVYWSHIRGSLIPSDLCARRATTHCWCQTIQHLVFIQSLLCVGCCSKCWKWDMSETNPWPWKTHISETVNKYKSGGDMSHKREKRKLKRVENDGWEGLFHRPWPLDRMKNLRLWAVRQLSVGGELWGMNWWLGGYNGRALDVEGGEGERRRREVATRCGQGEWRFRSLSFVGSRKDFGFHSEQTRNYWQILYRRDVCSDYFKKDYSARWLNAWKWFTNKMALKHSQTL
jgi:hypothetical protein